MDKFVELISKPIADAFFPLLKDKNKPERYTQLYNYLYNDVSKTVKEYFTANSFTTKKEVDAGIKNIIDELSIKYIINSRLGLTATPSSNTCPDSSLCYPFSPYCVKSVWLVCGCCYK